MGHAFERVIQGAGSAAFLAPCGSRELAVRVLLPVRRTEFGHGDATDLACWSDGSDEDVVVGSEHVEHCARLCCRASCPLIHGATSLSTTPMPGTCGTTGVPGQLGGRGRRQIGGGQPTRSRALAGSCRVARLYRFHPSPVPGTYPVHRYIRCGVRGCATSARRLRSGRNPYGIRLVPMYRITTGTRGRG
jgi:hypothetical protein